MEKLFKNQNCCNEMDKFLPDQKTIGNYFYWKNKFQDKFPDSFYFLMEAKCRNEYSNDDVQKIERIIKQEDEEWKLKLLKEIEERENLPAENFIKEEFRNKEINKNIIKE